MQYFIWPKPHRSRRDGGRRVTVGINRIRAVRTSGSSLIAPHATVSSFMIRRSAAPRRFPRPSPGDSLQIGRRSGSGRARGSSFHAPERSETDAPAGGSLEPLVADVCGGEGPPRRNGWHGMLPSGCERPWERIPMFGPDSCDGVLGGAPGSWSVRSGEKRPIARYGSSAGQDSPVSVVDPDAHDRIMAETVFLTQCVGKDRGRSRAGG